jgi:hypothetical protein
MIISRDPLSEGRIHAFDITGMAGLFPPSPVSFGREDEGIGRPEIGITHGTLTIPGRQRMPPSSGAGGGATTNKAADAVAGGLIQGQPNPPFVLFVTNKRPSFVTLNRQRSFFFTVPSTCGGSAAYF